MDAHSPPLRQREASYAASALAGCAAELAQAPQGTRNHTLNNVAYRMGRMVAGGWIEHAAVAAELSQACEVNGLGRDDGPNAVSRTLASGLTAGLGHPHPGLPDAPRTGRANSRSTQDSRAAFTFHRIGDHDPLHGPRFLIPGFVPERAVLFLTGKPGSRKSFLGIDWCCRVAAGLPVAGRPTIRGASVYLVGEGQAGIAGRVSAWEGANGIDGKTIPFRYCLRVPDIRNPDSINALIGAILDAIKSLNVPLALVVVDTFNKALSGGSDTKPEDVAAALRGMERIRDELGCAVITIHHPPRGEENRNRGLGMIDGDSDGTILVEWDKTEGVGVLTIGKLREGDEDAVMRFQTKRLTLGLHKVDGSKVESLVIEYPESDDQAILTMPHARRSRSDKTFEDAFNEAALNGGTRQRSVMGDGPIVPMVLLSDVQQEFVRRWATGNADPIKADEARGKAFRRALTKAVASQRFATEVVDSDELIWRASRLREKSGPTSDGTPDKTDTL
jgi:hypothetical protein